MTRENITRAKCILAERLGGLKSSRFCDFEKSRKRACQEEKVEFIKKCQEKGQQKLICGKEGGAKQCEKIWKYR